MRKMFCLFFIVSAAMLFGGASCEGNPISSVGVTANPDGTFGVNATLKHGQVLRYARVSQQWLDTMQARYPNVRAVYYDAPRYVDSRSVCPDARAALINSFAEIQAVQNRELALAEVVQLKPSLARRTRNFFAGRPILSFKGERVCNCAGAPEIETTPSVSFPVTPAPIFVQGPPATVLPDIDSTDNFTAEDNSILAEIEANDRAMTKTVNRVTCLADNYPNTQSELHECVRDVQKLAIKAVKKLGVKPSEVKMALNVADVKANIELKCRWAFDPTDWKPGDKRMILRSSHGTRDVGDDDGAIHGMLVTYDMVKTGRWDATTEVQNSFWREICSTIPDGCNGLIWFDTCYSGDSIRRIRTAKKSITGPQYVVDRVEDATKSVQVTQGIERMNVTFLTACGPGQVSEEDQNGGAGTQALLVCWDNYRPTDTGATWAKAMRAFEKAHGYEQRSEVHGGGANKPLWK